MKIRVNHVAIVVTLFGALLGSACNAPTSTGPFTTGVETSQNGEIPAPSAQSDVTPPPAEKPARVYATGALVFNGSGTAGDDTASVVALLKAKGLTYRVVTSAQLNAMTLEEIADHGVIVWPGGKAKTMSDSLTAATEERVRTAVAEHGVGYVGFCAGAFVTGDYGSWGLKFVPIDFPYYYLEYQGVVTAMVEVTFADGSTRDLVWYGGPELANFGQPIAKHPDGTTAIGQDFVGQGLVILSGPHPEAPDSWRAGLNDSDGNDLELTWKLIDAALKGEPVEGY